MLSRATAFTTVCLAVLGSCDQERRVPAREENPEAAAQSPADQADQGHTRSAGDSGERPTTQPVAPDRGDTTALGIVRVVGPNPFPQFVLAPPPPGGPAVALEGALRDELGALVGIEVRVRGRAIAHQPPLPDRAILVSSYEVVSVAGRKPDVGVLLRDGGHVTLSGTRLVGAPDDLRNAIGAKVWVLGTTRDGALAVESYGIIRRP